MLTIMHHSRYDLLNKYLLTVNKRQKTSLFKYQDSMFFANLLIKGYAQALLPSMYLDREIMVQSPTSSWVNIYFSGQLLNKVRRWGYSQSQWATSNTNITPSPKQTWNWVGRLLRTKIKSKKTMSLLDGMSWKDHLFTVDAWEYWAISILWKSAAWPAG